MRKYAWISAGVILALAGYFVVAVAFAGGIEPVGADEGEDLLAAVRLGCDATTARVFASAGVVTLHEWNWRDNGELLETETVYTVASKGERFKAGVDTRYIRNEWTPPEPNLRVNTPGTVERIAIAYDGERVTMHEPGRRLAVIAGADSEAGRLLRTVKLMALSPGHAVPKLQWSPSSPARSAPYVVGRDILNGEECILVETVLTAVIAGGAQAEYYDRFWVVPGKGFSVAKSECEARGGIFGEKFLLSQAEVETRQYDDGLWGTSQVRQEEYRVDNSGGRYLSARRVASFSDDYALNAPVTDEMLTVVLPSGTSIHNELIDAEYSVP